MSGAVNIQDLHPVGGGERCAARGAGGCVDETFTVWDTLVCPGHEVWGPSKCLPPVGSGILYLSCEGLRRCEADDDCQGNGDCQYIGCCGAGLCVIPRQ